MAHGWDGRRGGGYGDRGSRERWRGTDQGLSDGDSQEGSLGRNAGCGSGSSFVRNGGRGDYGGAGYRGRGREIGLWERGRGRHGNFERGEEGGGIGYGERGRGRYGSLGSRGEVGEIRRGETGRRGGRLGEERWDGGTGRGWAEGASSTSRSGASKPPAGGCRTAAGPGLSLPNPREYVAVTAREAGAESGSGSGGWRRNGNKEPVAEMETRVVSGRPWGEEKGKRVDMMAEDFSRMNVNTDESASRLAFPLAKRPDAGGEDGQMIDVTANYFRLSVNIKEIHLYSVDIRRSVVGGDREVVSRSTRREVEQALLKQYSGDLEGGLQVFDGSNLLYSAQKLPFTDRSFKISVRRSSVSDTSRDFVVHLKFANVLSLPVRSLQGQANVVTADLLQALNIVVREHPTRSLLPIGRSLFYGIISAPSVSGSLEILPGFTPSIRNTQEFLALNLDYTGAVFYKNISIIDFLHDQIKGLNPSLPFTRQQLDQALNALRGLKVNVNHRQSKQNYVIRGLTANRTEEVRFRLNDAEEGPETTIVDFFRLKYNRPLLRTTWPCLQIAGSGNMCLPMEVCSIAPHQRYRGSLERNTQNMVCIPAWDRQQRIYSLMQEEHFSPAKGDFVGNFGVEINPQMTVVPARVLKPPGLKYSSKNGQDHPLTPLEKGSWNLLRGVQCRQGCRIPDWAIINFDSQGVREEVVLTFTTKLVQRCKDLGVGISENSAIEPLTLSEEHLRNPAAILRGLRQIKEACRSRLPLVICIMGDKDEAYGKVKTVADMDVGIVTQCCTTKCVKKCCTTHQMSSFESQYLANVVLKLNAKFEGQNVELSQPIPDMCPVLSEPTIIFGADVTHPRATEDKPSIAAVVASTDWPAASKYAARQSMQTGREEMIQNLGDMAKELWKIFVKQTKTKPGKVLFFRDGVGEGQYEELLRRELMVLRTALREIGGESYDPAVTMILVQKRHHTRLFPKDMFRQKNVAAGTVVDTAITHPRDFDFYLCSHEGIVGTSKPCRYQVLFDDIGFSSDGIQSLTNRLCYTYVRCTRAVSYVPPAYYAHLAAFRARFYVDFRPGLWQPGSQATILPLHRDIQDTMFFA